MKSSTEIGEAQARAMRVYERRPDKALSSMSIDARIEGGLACTITDGTREVIVDMPEPVGGDSMGPTPGFHARAAVAGCVAIGIKMTAAREGIELKSVNVNVGMDFDDSAVFAMGENTAAPLKTIISIDLESDTGEAELKAMVDRALASDTYFLALRDPQVVETRLKVV